MHAKRTAAALPASQTRHTPRCWAVMQTAIFPSEHVRAALFSPGCAGLVSASTGAVASAGGCHVPVNSSLLHLSLLGPFALNGQQMTEHLFEDVLDLSSILTGRDVSAQALFVAPLDSFGYVMPNPPVELHHFG